MSPDPEPHPRPLIDYLRTSPLPTLVLPLILPSHFHHNILPTPILSNFALAQLAGGKHLYDCLSPAAVSLLLTWLYQPPSPSSSPPINYTTSGPVLPSSQAPTIDPSTPDSDISIDLHLGTPQENNQRVMTVFWRKSQATEAGLDLTIITALAFPPRRLSRLTGDGQLDSLVRNVVAQDVPDERSDREKLNEYEMLADCSAVGLARLDLEGRVVWVNSSWLEITEHEDGVPLAEWSRCLDQDSYKKLLTEFKQCRQLLVPLVGRFRLKSGKLVLANCTPNHKDPTLVTGWISNLTDVTAQVKAEEALSLLALERERADRQAEAMELIEERRRDAEEQRKQQELLIDVTSHEIRNPISAILQNSELARSSLLRLQTVIKRLYQDASIPEVFVRETIRQLDEDVEALESIWECALAQERIANDILGLAQIGANRYSITPIPFSLISSIRGTLRMFTTECRAKGIELELDVGPRLASLEGTNSVLADPVRLSQIVTNLISNAVRFTASRPTRKIVVGVEVSPLEPEAGAPLAISPTLRNGCPSPNRDPSIEVDAPLFIYFQVTDTGPGMTLEETQRVFERFMQATPLTHVTMGGSGLGLWIARSLCELHGGRIEVVSTLGVGSTFRGFVRGGTGPFTPSKDNDVPGAGGHVSSSTVQGGMDVLQHLPSSPNPNVGIAGMGTARTSFDLSLSPTVSRLIKVLIVDDNQINRRILVRQLGQTGLYQVDTAGNGLEALDMMDAKCREGEGEGYDCCLMDVEMPLMNGIRATQELRAREAESGKHRLWVVGCTGNARDAQLRAALDSGMDEIVTKPYRLPDLMEKLVPLPLRA
ncbi:hypothetical protein T439DRAFT_328383 [Meredithblackwellia eburnea MCA 4105]